MKKREIGIITLYGNKNYGNKLQNYALIQVLNQIGYNAKTIMITEKKSMNLNFLNIMKYLKSLIKNYVVLILSIVVRSRRINKKRIRIFEKFHKSHIPTVRYKIYSTQYSSIDNDFDCFVVGSDQVWNPRYITSYKQLFLDFASDFKKNAYAASFGIESLTQKDASTYKNYLSSFNRISVRETTGKQIVRNLTDLSVPVLVDPTLLLNSEQWLSISKIPRYLSKNKFLLTYFLGTPNSNELEFIQTISTIYNYDLIDLNSPQKIKQYFTSPNEFLYLINKAECVLTDSFHGVVFSIIFKTSFVVFRRNSNGKSMYSRITELLEKFNFNERAFHDDFKMGSVFDTDFSLVDNIIEVNRHESLEFLRSMLHKRDNNE